MMSLKVPLLALAALALVASAHAAALVPMIAASTANVTTQLSTTITVDEYTLTLTAPTAIT
jgi:hypothetical protein